MCKLVLLCWGGGVSGLWDELSTDMCDDDDYSDSDEEEGEIPEDNKE